MAEREGKTESRAEIETILRRAIQEFEEDLYPVVKNLHSEWPNLSPKDRRERLRGLKFSLNNFFSRYSLVDTGRRWAEFLVSQPGEKKEPVYSLINAFTVLAAAVAGVANERTVHEKEALALLDGLCRGWEEKKTELKAGLAIETKPALSKEPGARTKKTDPKPHKDTSSKAPKTGAKPIDYRRIKF